MQCVYTHSKEVCGYTRTKGEVLSSAVSLAGSAGDMATPHDVAGEAVVALADIYVHFTIAAAIHFASAR